MGMQQTFGGVARIIAPLFYGWAFDSIGVSSPYYFSSAIIAATVFLGFGLDKYARHEPSAALIPTAPSLPIEPELEGSPEIPMAAKATSADNEV